MMPDTPQLLTPEEVEFFDTHGYVHLKSVISEEMLEHLMRPINRWMARLTGRWKKKGFTSSTFEELPFDQRLHQAWLAADKKPLYKEFVKQEVASKEMYDFISHNVFRQITRDILRGENIIAISAYALRPKLPSKDLPVDTPWHQDNQCNKLFGNELEIITIWIPFMDVDEDNACLQVEEGFHKKGIVYDFTDMSAMHYSIPDEETNKFSNIKTIRMKRGDALVMNRFLPHRSLSNRTDKMRWSLDIRFERLASPEIPKPKRGFVISHEDSRLVDKTYEQAFENLWLDGGPPTDQ